MSTVIGNATGAGGYDKRLLSKGLAKDIIDSCSQFVNGNGQVQSIGDDKRNELSRQIEQMQSQGVECFAFAYRDLQEGQFGSDHSENTSNQQDDGLVDAEREGLTFIALIGLIDTMRPETPYSI